MQAANHNYQHTTPKADALSDWMSQKISQSSHNCKAHIETYRFDLAAAEIYELVWSNFCDWYIELSKIAIQKSKDPFVTADLIGNLFKNFESILKLLHPFMPFISEELFAKINSLKGLDKGKFLVEVGFDELATVQANEIDEVIKIISEIRVIRNENVNIKNETLHLVLSGTLSPNLHSLITGYQEVICGIAKLDAIEFNSDDYEESIEKTMIDYKIIIPLAGLIDPKEELARLEKELSSIENDIKIIGSKLENEQFISKAPDAVIQKEKGKIAEAENKKLMLEKSIAKLRA
jgi:valyl-tRNA synthetase